MGSLKMELKKEWKQKKKAASQILEQIEAIDDDDKVAIDAVRSKVGVETDIIPDETPIYVTGPGFDDFSTPEEAERFRNKYPNIILINDIPLADDSPIGKSNNQQVNSENTAVSLKSSLEQSEEEFSLQEISDDTEMQSKFEQMLEELEKAF